jgi:hypothetical protein
MVQFGVEAADGYFLAMLSVIEGSILDSHERGDHVRGALGAANVAKAANEEE